MVKPPGFASYDLHLHTCWSYDATADVEVHFRRARELGVRCIAITEHHNIDSAPEVRAVAERYPEVRLIPAAELSVTTSIGSVDLLCYNLPHEPSGALARVLEAYHQWQRERGAALVEGMQKLGYDYTAAHHLEVLATYRPRRVLEVQGATHVKGSVQRDEFIRRGFASNAEEYAALLQRVGEVVPRPPFPAVEDVVPAVKEAGGLVVIAHPKGYFRGDDRQRMDALRHECDLDGIECAHRKVDPELTTLYRDYCIEHGLVSVGGSDSHDNVDVQTPVETPGYTPERRFACHVGADHWLDELLERLGQPASGPGIGS